uniref:Reverse transcriptase/retrotransposon-derived protein RNase H-like domain-containing protein n=1 Tax=Cannabis sativa TaxID=3483 RepID=A0A803QHL8_CANSA
MGLKEDRRSPAKRRKMGVDRNKAVNDEVTKMLKNDTIEELGLTMEAYIDDMLVKFKDRSDHVDRLRECFQILLAHSMKLNLAKCAFAVGSGKFLDHLVTRRGVELSDKSLPFYDLLRGNQKFKWDEKCQLALEALKRYLTTPPVLSKPETGETLLLYLSLSKYAASSVLVREQGKAQLPIYYTNKTFLGAEGDEGRQGISSVRFPINSSAGLRGFEAKEPKMISYLAEVNKLASTLEYFQINQIPRGENMHADALAGLGSSSSLHITRTIPFDFVTELSITKEEEFQCTEVLAEALEDWRQPILEYLRDDKLQSDPKQARKVVTRASTYALLQNQLYKRSYNGPYLKCVKRQEGKLILTEVHEGECGSHSGGRVTAQRVQRQGYYWLTIREDSADHSKKCEKC